MPTARSEFRNKRDHYIGVMTRREDNKMKSLAVPPEGTIWLDEEEQIATANAPRSDADNPFTNGDLELLTPATVVANRRPIGFSEHPNPAEVTQAEPTPAAGDPGGDAGGTPEGSQEPAGGEQEAGDGGEPQKPADPPPVPPQGRRERSKEEAEASARAASARRRAPAPGDAGTKPAPKAPETTATAPQEAGDAAKGSRAPAEEVGTPGAAEKGSEKAS